MINYVYNDIDSTMLEKDTVQYIEIKTEDRKLYKEPPMYINILVATLFIIGGIIVMITRPKHN